MKKYNFAYILLSLLFSFASLCLIFIKVFSIVLISDVVFIILLSSIIFISIVLSVIAFITFRVYVLDLFGKYNKLKEVLESNSGESINIDGLDEITKPINNFLIEYKTLRYDFEKLKEKEYKTNDILIELSKGNLSIKVDEELYIIKKVLSYYREMFILFFQVVLKTSESLYSLNEMTSKLIREYGKFEEIFLKLSEKIETASGKFAGLSGHLVKFIDDIIDSSESLKTIDDASSKIYSSITKLREISSNMKQNSDDTFKEVDNINNISKRISEISEQALLLSMNAIIESSKMGDYAKGFSVIADEIRKLSESINKFSKLIINEMQILKGKINSNKIFSEDILGESEILTKNLQVINTVSSSFNKKLFSIIDSVERISGALNELSYDFSSISEEDNELLKEYSIIKSLLVDARKDVFELSGVIEDVSRLMQNRVNLMSTKIDLIIALSAHIWFINRLFGHLDNVIQVNQKEVLDHTQCLLGQWYYSDKSKFVSQYNEFKILEDVHIKLHQISREIVEYKGKSASDLERMSDTLISTSHSIISLLKKMIELLPAEEHSQ